MMRGYFAPSPGNTVNLAAAARFQAASHARFRQAPRRRTRNNAETPHPMETLHAYSVFYFRRMQSFHANGG
jgi:hypothetical protein